MDVSDISIIEDICKGNTYLFENIIDKYNKKVYGYILSLVKNPHTAEELTQETFVKTYKNLGKYDRDKEFSIWIFRIARNTVLDYFRKTTKSSTYELNENLDSDIEDRSLTNPEEIIERKEKIAIIEEIIESLPKKYKDLIILKYFDELSYIEISSRLRMPQDKVKWSLYQARKKLINEYAKYEIKEKGSEAYGM